uniref:PAS domain-containing protein n=1 Tax=Desertifilum tharense IPPAS B-1220 TaxID=1781255 RepID=A0ACD5GN84_9CYAN
MFWLGFSLGLLVGLALLVGYRVWLELKLKNLLPDLKSDTLRATRSSLSRLLWAIAFQQETCRDLENQVERWKQLLYLAPIGYIQVDEENQLCWCNQQACQLLGIQAPAAARPRLLLEIVRSYELDELIEVTRDAQKPCQREWTFQPTCADPTNLSQQQAIALRGIGIPLTRGEVGVFLENCQEVLILSQQRDRAFSDVAHELKTPSPPFVSSLKPCNLVSIPLAKLGRSLIKRSHSPQRSRPSLARSQPTRARSRVLFKSQKRQPARTDPILLAQFGTPSPQETGRT